MLLHLRSADEKEEPLEINARPGEKLSHAIWLSGKLRTLPMCGGLGTCGQCLVRFLSDPPPPSGDEEKFLEAEKIALGWRLSCRHVVPDRGGPLELLLPSLAPAPRHARPVGDTAPRLSICLGVDLGTTSIEWRAVSETGETVANGKTFNPQAGAGADIIARLAAAMSPDGMDRLASLTWDCLSEITTSLREKGLSPSRACVAANSALTHILLRKNISGLCHAPYALAFKGGDILDIDLYGKKIPCVFPPLVSAFVGGDITSGLLWLIRSRTPRPFILADLGTNAELAMLTTDKHLFLASVPLGPAMEGIGPRCGRVAGPDAATSFQLSPGGLSPVPANAAGISATGYLSLLALLLNAGIMDREGHFQTTAVMPLTAAISAKIHNRDGRPRLDLSKYLFLDADDVEMLLKVKAAFAVALSRLLKKSGLGLADISTLILGGALGEHASPRDLETLGFIPRALTPKTRSGGNTSLLGASLLAQKPELLKPLKKLCEKAEILALTDDPRFLEDYTRAMRWGTDV